LSNNTAYTEKGLQNTHPSKLNKGNYYCWNARATT